MRLNIKKAVARKPRWLALAPYLEKWIPAPFFLLIHITLGCEEKCEFCYQVRDPFFKKHEGIIKPSDFEKILLEGSRLIYKPHIHLFGGEPLDHPEFPLLLDLCQRYGFKPTFTTNGEGLLQHSEAIRDSNVTQINIFVGVMRQVEDFPPLVLKFIKSHHPRIRFNLNYTIFKESVPALLSTVEQCAFLFSKGQVETFVCQHWNFDKKDCAVARRIEVDSLKCQLEDIKARSWPFAFFSLPDIAIDDIKKYYWDWKFPFVRKCYVPWLGLSVYPDLAVSPGGAVFHCTEVVGSLHDQTLRGIWRSEKLRRFRKLLRAGLPERCMRCCHNQYY